MSQNSSTIQVLTVEVEPTKWLDKETGKPGERHIARCILLSDDGEVVTVGRLRVPKALIGSVQKGTYRAGFALGVSDFGDNKGDIMPVLASLTPVGKSAPAAPSKAA